MVPPSYEDGPGLHAATLEQGVEGIISKRRGSTYQPGVRSFDWLKFPHRMRHSYVIGGWRPETDTEHRIGSVLVGEPTSAGLIFRGRVGAGLAGRVGPALLAALEPHARADSPFDDEVPRSDAARVRWVDPVLVIDVEALGMNPAAGGIGARLRQPTYRGLRTDLDLEDLDVAEDV